MQDFACTRCPAACERFVDVLGLKILFSIFMGKSKVGRTSFQAYCCTARISQGLKALSRSSMAHLTTAGNLGVFCSMLPSFADGKEPWHAHVPWRDSCLCSDCNIQQWQGLRLRLWGEFITSKAQHGLLGRACHGTCQ